MYFYYPQAILVIVTWIIDVKCGRHNKTGAMVNIDGVTEKTPLLHSASTSQLNGTLTSTDSMNTYLHGSSTMNDSTRC